MWQFSAPKIGWVAFVVDEAALVVWNGSAWADYFSTVAIQNLSMLGLGTTADTTNRVSAKLNNTLWTAKTIAEGGDGNMRYKLSKESAAKTVSLVMQDNFSGRAEVGLTGDDDFHFKVSPDGTTWYEGIKIAAASGAVTFPNTTIAGGRELLTANRTYYVRTDGSNSNSGLANTSGGAFLTLQKAINVAAALDLSIYNVTIQIANGTYTAGALVTAPWVGAGTVTLLGDAATPSNVVIATTNANAIEVKNGGVLGVSGIKMVTSGGSSGDCMNANNFGIINIAGKVDFGAAATFYDHIRATIAGIVNINSDYSISGAAYKHYDIFAGGALVMATRTITLSGTLAFNTFASASRLSNIRATGCSYTGGTVTGSRYLAEYGGVLDSGGGGASYFPGNSAGSVTAGAQYI